MGKHFLQGLEKKQVRGVEIFRVTDWVIRVQDKKIHLSFAATIVKYNDDLELKCELFNLSPSLAGQT